MRESWFENNLTPKESDASIRLSVPLMEGRLGWAIVLGAFGGGGGGAAMLLVANEVALRLHLDVDIIKTIGSSAGMASIIGGDSHRVGLALGVTVGAMVGVLIGGLMRYSQRLRSRALAGALIGTALWLFVQAFVLKSVAGSLGALPLVPMLVGAAVYGLCAAILPPPRKRIYVDDLDD